MSIYYKHLRRIGILTIVLNILQVVFMLGTCIWYPDTFTPAARICALLEGVLGIAMGVIALLLNRNTIRVKYTILPSAVILIATGVLLYLENRDPDSLIDFCLLLLFLSVYLQYQLFTRDRRMDRVNKGKPLTLDLRISGIGELFNPIVMSPHLEMNQGILDAVDRFLETAACNAPLNLCIHSSSRISVPLQDTMDEVFRAHYEDEEQRVNRFLESRYTRSIALIIISTGALRILSFIPGAVSGGIILEILGNLAAFSLWQIGSTYFERNAALGELIRIRIARECRITFE